MYLHSQADQRLKQNHEDLLLLAHLQELHPSGKESGLMLIQELIRISLSQCEKRMTTLFRHGPSREEGGAIEFWRLKDDLRNEFENSKSDEMWKSKMAGGGGIKKRFQYCMDSSGHEILYLRAPQGHSGRNSIDPELKDNVFITNLRVHLSHRVCNQFTLHHEFRIDTRRTKFQQKTDGILHVCGSNEQGTQRSRCN